MVNWRLPHVAPLTRLSLSPAYPPLKALFYFAYHEAMACLFAVFILAMLMITHLAPLPFLPRYDVMLVACILMQIAMVWWLKIETVDELKVICLFHILGTTMEIFKVTMGSWSYPGEAYSKFLGVPIYGGFMYASVASYITQAWRRLDMVITNLPSTAINVIIGLSIYLNFFAHHFIYDFRYLILGTVGIIYLNTTVHFTAGVYRLKMPLIISFGLIGFFIWFAENIATFFGAWQYPNQAHEWNLVHPGKVLSWLLLFIVSFLIVAQLKRIKARREGVAF
jgi:uncharacterized membrane protein YoaT (DUF817 family)